MAHICHTKWETNDLGWIYLRDVVISYYYDTGLPSVGPEAMYVLLYKMFIFMNLLKHHEVRIKQSYQTALKYLFLLYYFIYSRF